ncbi:transcription termination factor Rho [Candidatus Shapirobacteria bacterium CG08_land_8_20_14_0_20_39_18]|uniref:Transcription termination factor Rho n=1 Tax=Candidatus Shapirobacteria bacterium CG08_land_8_20_14_0_20_39_18 TaxID=1974883 RepID=A0A2M6XCD7_9BACT|nr:MAG: transcription termination factor Rho [Candidatus Shapirobacteria bacterium CG08_land_8_20_14_0_20_39_18]PIY65575.1 MAG: transcription termination factor Rho [Candidatus Shapirobacteria bacterium CG_4_10_14_0_8_um_filter_39_15]
MVVKAKNTDTPTVEEITGNPVPAGFNGVVDNRIIPDADLPTEYVEGILSIADEGHGYLRPKFIPGFNDVYISSSQIRRFGLRVGDLVGGQARQPKDNERYFGLLKVEKVNGEPIDSELITKRPYFDDLLPIFPQPQIKLETEKDVLTTRMMDLISPIGNGQRGLIVSPPKAGKTWLLKDIAAAVSKNYPKMHLMAILIGERPEEVTDLGRFAKGEVVASNFDEAPENQTRTANIALERAKRLVEMGKDVFIILDSITRLARAYNLAMPTSGRTLTGGFDPAALFPAKHFFGAGRKIENAGSLTIIGTCLIDTGSRMDDLVYEEFKGTGNMELHLDRRMAERRIFPAIDIQRSGTRQEELLYDPKIYPRIVTIRRAIDAADAENRTEDFINSLKKSETNEEFLAGLGKG